MRRLLSEEPGDVRGFPVLQRDVDDDLVHPDGCQSSQAEASSLGSAETLDDPQHDPERELDRGPASAAATRIASIGPASSSGSSSGSACWASQPSPIRPARRRATRE